jgi:DNA excision repair protein ERCC-2
MWFNLDGLPVCFPYAAIYPEQHAYMGELKRALDARGHAVLEMPTGTGKTAALLSLITSYALANPSRPLRLLYCTHTVHEMDKTLAELRLLFSHLPDPSHLLALGLSSRKNLCVHPQVSASAAVDTGCRRLTASWVREKAASDRESTTPLCDYFETFDTAAHRGDLASYISPGVYTLADLRSLGCQRRICPYFLARHLVKHANVVVYTYQYLLDPKVASIVSPEMEMMMHNECVVVFDEAHNIDNVCIEALSVTIRKQTLEGAQRNLQHISQEIDR